MVHSGVLKAGGNAADAAVACAAGMNLCQPDTTGIGGDVFCLYFDNATKQVHGLNGRLTLKLCTFKYWVLILKFRKDALKCG